jgi:molecular chaperone GrpE
MPESNPSPESYGNGDAAGTAVIHDLETLQARISDAEQKRDEYLDLLQRTRADFENYQKRAQRETIQERKYAHGDLAHDLLAALDNLDRATAAAKQAGDKSSLAQGVTLVQTQLLDILRRHGVTPIEAKGKPFDPNQHQAVMQQPSPDLPPNSVVQILEQGFMIHDRVLRPAKVIVSSPP